MPVVQVRWSFEATIDSARAFLYAASVMLLVRRIARAFDFRNRQSAIFLRESSARPRCVFEAFEVARSRLLVIVALGRHDAACCQEAPWLSRRRRKDSFGITEMSRR